MNRVLLGVLYFALMGCSDPGPQDGPPDGAGPGNMPSLDLAGAQVGDGGSPGAGDLSQPSAALTPPKAGSSGGSSGGATGGIATRATPGGIQYRLIVPGSYSAAQKTPLLIVYSGTEGGANMAQNLVSLVQPVPSLGGYIHAVLDGVTYNGDAAAGAAVLDEVRAQYNIDNDRTYLLGESAGTTAAFALGFHLRQSYFAAYWANDVSAASADGPSSTAAELGFTPFGQVGPGGATALANAIAAKLKAAGYHTDAQTPYAGSGSTTHGATDQLIAAVGWFEGKSR